MRHIAASITVRRFQEALSSKNLLQASMMYTHIRIQHTILRSVIGARTWVKSLESRFNWLVGAEQPMGVSISDSAPSNIFNVADQVRLFAVAGIRLVRTVSSSKYMASPSIRL
jgi:hypothetical protein